MQFFTSVSGLSGALWKRRKLIGKITFIQFVVTFCAIAGSLSLSILAGAQERPVVWPTGSNYTSSGAFRAWSSASDDPLIDISKLNEVTDIKQVYVHGGGWVVLRSDGTTVSSNGAADREGIREICHGWDQHFSFITQTGGVIGFSRSREFELMCPTERGPVKDIYIDPNKRVVLFEDGSIRIWGKAFDGIKKEGNSEWMVKPALPEGRTAIAMSCIDHVLAFKLDNQELIVFKSNGPLEIPAHLGPNTIGDFSVNRGRFFCISNEDAKPYFSEIGNFSEPLRKHPVGAGGQAVEFVEGTMAVVVANSAGEIRGSGAYIVSIPGMREATESVKVFAPNHFSMFGRYGDIGPHRILWYDSKAVPAPTAELEITLVAPVSNDSMIPRNSESMVPDSKEVKKRLFGYQRARQEAITGLAIAYRQQLGAADTAARTSGNLEQVEAVRSAIEHADQLLNHLTSLATSTNLAPIVPLPAIAASAPGEVHRNRKVFNEALLENESNLYVALDQSLEFVQTEFVKSRVIEDARSTQNYRDHLEKIFAPVSLVTSQRAVAEEVSSSSKPASSQPISSDPGILKAWSFMADKLAVDLRQGSGIKDFIQVYTWHNGWVALRSNGETVTIDGDNEKKNISKICPGWGDNYGLIDNDGKLILIGDSAPSPPRRPVDVVDAFISAGHCLALSSDGNVRIWGDNYRKDNRPWIKPPDEVLSGVKSIAGSNNIGIVLSESGDAYVWRDTGQCNLPDTATSDLIAVGCNHDVVNVIHSNGTCEWWAFSGKSGGEREDITKADAVAITPMGKQVLFHLSDGRLRMGNAVWQREFQKQLGSIGQFPPGRVAGFRGGGKDNHVIWIQSMP